MQLGDAKRVFECICRQMADSVVFYQTSFFGMKRNRPGLSQAAIMMEKQRAGLQFTMTRSISVGRICFDGGSTMFAETTNSTHVAEVRLQSQKSQHLNVLFVRLSVRWKLNNALFTFPKFAHGHLDSLS